MLGSPDRSAQPDRVGGRKIALEQTPPELGADIAERGMMLTGGVARCCATWIACWPRKPASPVLVCRRPADLRGARLRHGARTHGQAGQHLLLRIKRQREESCSWRRSVRLRPDYLVGAAPRRAPPPDPARARAAAPRRDAPATLAGAAGRCRACADRETLPPAHG
ncbi:rod shape-determining protein [Cupriavidus basilensis]